MFIKLPMGTNKKTSSGKVQLKLSLPDDVVERLEAVAVKAGKNSKQEVVEELITFYLPVWITVNESMNRAVEYQIRTVSEEIAAKNREPKELVAGKKISKEKIFKEASEDEYTRLASRRDDEKNEND